MSEKATDRFLTRAEVEERVGLQRSAIYSMMRRGCFPAPFKLGAKTVRWSLREIEEWCSTRPRSHGVAGVAQ